VVVGSALVNCAAEAVAGGGSDEAAMDAVADLVRELRQGVDSFAS
jgi:tryptophan synthase alpha subunit